MKNDVAVIILSYNEEINAAQALASVCEWAGEVYIVDSFSTDATVAVARNFRCEVFEKRFEDYAKQRNWALDNLPIRSQWILFLDADEWIPGDLKEEISAMIVRNPSADGFLIRRRFIWMGKWIRRGYYPTWLLRLFRRGKGRCEARGINEHIIVDGETGYLRHDFIHEDRKGVSDWIEKHNRYADREARELLPTDSAAYMAGKFFGTKAERVRWLRESVYKRLPLLLRPVLYFLYRYVLRRGFLDGKQALIYHFLHGLWYQMLIDIKYLELVKAAKIAAAESRQGEEVVVGSEDGK